MPSHLKLAYVNPRLTASATNTQAKRLAMKSLKLARTRPSHAQIIEDLIDDILKDTPKPR
jgi:hypothetical protein